MNTKKQFMIGIIGGIVGSLITVTALVTACVVFPVTVPFDQFGYIRCTGLLVTESDRFYHFGGPQVSIDAHEDSAHVKVYGGLDSSASLNVYPDGGSVSAGGAGDSSVSLVANKYGGERITVYSKDGKVAELGVIGRRAVLSKDGKSFTWFSDNEHGAVAVYGSKGKGKAVMGINTHGNGAVHTWDKNGYRQ